MEKINFLDLHQQHQSIKKEIFEAFEKVYDSTAFSSGPFVEEFEQNFAAFCGAKYAVGVNNGTSALHLALLAMNLKSGDEIIVPANTFISTAWAVSYIGATPVFVDCTPDTWQIDPGKIEEKITAKTKAVIGVHLYGQPFDIDAVKAVCEKNNLQLLTDAAQAHGARYKGVQVGGIGDMECFSFYPGKNLGACGEAGAITTNQETYAQRLRSLRNHGSTVRYYHDEIGFNMRMGGLEGASLNVKLKYLDQWNDKRREIAGMYRTGIQNDKIQLQHLPEWADSVYHLFVITVDDRNGLIKHLNQANIFPGMHYPVPCHLQKAYTNLGYQKGYCPNAEYQAGNCVTLPMYAELDNIHVGRIIDAINEY